MSVFTGKVLRRAEPPQSGDNTRAMRILGVEDEERLARLISRGLAEEGYAVETEANGRRALMLALADEYDLLIVDWMLPDLSGVQLVKRLRAAEVGTPALMLTARDQIEDRVEGLDAGADDYLPKPFAFPNCSPALGPSPAVRGAKEKAARSSGPATLRSTPCATWSATGERSWT